MDDLAALTQAVLAAEGDDLPRLVLADYLEEHDEPERAAFIRSQCEIASAAPWDPIAVHARHHRPDWLDGRDFLNSLPETGSRFVEWFPTAPFRRGFGWSLLIRDLTDFLNVADELFDQAPIGELHLPTAALSEWQRFARRSWLPRVRSVHFYGVTTPIEPIRVLCDAPLATGLNEIVFEKAGSPAMPELVAALVRSPLGRRLKSLQFHVGYESLVEFINAFAVGPGELQLKQLLFRITGLAPDLVRLMLRRPILDHLDTLNVEYAPQLGSEGMRLLTKSPKIAGLESLRLDEIQADDVGLAILASSTHLRGLKALDLSHNLFTPYGIRRLCQSTNLSNLRSLTLRKTGLQSGSLILLGSATYWQNLVELDLADNRITDEGVDILTGVPMPADLTAIVLRGNPLSVTAVEKLREHFGWRLVFD